MKEKHRPEDIVIVARGKTIFGDIVVTYFYKGEPELIRMKIKGDD